MVSGRKASFSSVERREIPRLFPHSFLLPILKTGTILESFLSYGSFSVSQICRASFYGLEASSTLPCFRISADIPHLQAAALPFFVTLIAFNSSLNSCFSSRHAMFDLCTTVSKAERSATLVIFWSWSKWFANLQKTHLSPKDCLTIKGTKQVSGKLPTYPSPKLTSTLIPHLAQNVGLGEG